MGGVYAGHYGISWFCISFNAMMNNWRGWSSLLPYGVLKVGLLLEGTSSSIPAKYRHYATWCGQCWKCTVLKAMCKLFTEPLKHRIKLCAQRITVVPNRIRQRGEAMRNHVTVGGNCIRICCMPGNGERERSGGNRGWGCQGKVDMKRAG